MTVICETGNWFDLIALFSFLSADKLYDEVDYNNGSTLEKDIQVSFNLLLSFFIEKNLILQNSMSKM